MPTPGLHSLMQDGVLVLRLDMAPSNALGPEMRRALIAGLAERPNDCRAVILVAEGPHFCSKMPIEPDTEQPGLPEMCGAVATAGVPVVAAVHGLVMGPGAELALAATARVARKETRMAFAEVVLGLCPGGGSAQRLVALAGAPLALDLMLSGRVVEATEALAQGLVDEVVEDGSLLAVAHRLALQLAVSGQPARRPHPVPEGLSAVARAREARSRGLPAELRIIDCIEAALLLPPEAAVAFEDVARMDLEHSPEAAALRAATLAERRAALIPARVARAPARPLTLLGLSGHDPDLAVLADAALSRGVPVRWYAPGGQDELRSGLSSTHAAALQTAEDPQALADCTVLVRTRQAIGPFGVADGPVVLTLGWAESGLGLSLSPPRPAGQRLAELAIWPQNPAPMVATAVATLRRLGFSVLLVGKRPHLGRKVLAAGRAAVARLAAMGVPGNQLAAALAPFGWTVLQSDGGQQAAREMNAEEIRLRWMGAMANAGLQMLEEAVALRPSDIDLALITGHGLARWQGGPMHHADRRGLMVLRHDLRTWSADDPLWYPAGLLDHLIRDSLRLEDLDRRG